MDIAEEIKKAGITASEYTKLQQFVAILEEWNGKMNLVSKNSFAEVWPRHILDSAQLINYIPTKAKYLVDIGSGAGFPGIVLAILLQERNPLAKVTLIESITKKTVYLKDVCERLALHNVEIINNRVENTVFKAVDVITARAVAALDVLCAYAKHIGQPQTKMLFLKGQKWGEEDELASQHWNYELTVYPNKQCLDAVVLELTNLRKKK